MANSSPHRDALRIMFILIAGASKDGSNTAIFKGEARLYAFDFWMRNPDYLAEELLDLYERTLEMKFLLPVIEIFDAEEPDVRCFPMIRYRFGAFERIDDAMSILRSRDLIKITGRKAGDIVQETDFVVMPAAFDLAKRIVDDYPPLRWYEQRAELVSLVAGVRGGTALKRRQYEQAEYAETQLGGIIPPVASRVKARLNNVMDKARNEGVAYEAVK